MAKDDLCLIILCYPETANGKVIGIAERGQNEELLIELFCNLTVLTDA